MLHSPTISRWRTQLIEISCNIFTCSSVSEQVGATTIDSPVCIPSGSKFSIEATVKQWSLASRITSNSISFHPFSDSSTRICGAKVNALPANSRKAASSRQIPEPRPPKAYAERIITGNPMRRAAARASSIFSTAWLTGVFSSFSLSLRTKRSRSSVFMIASTDVPNTSTPNSLSVPF